MRKKITLSLYVFLLVFAACKKEDSFPDLDDNPQTEAYKKNKVSAYVVYSNPGSADASKDSVLINEHGLPTTHFNFYTANNKTKSRTVTITYDSIDRIKEYSADGDFPFKMKMKYRKDDKQKMVFVNVGSGIMHYQFDNDFKKVTRIYIIDSTSPDTVNDFYYKYKNGKIASISQKSNNKLSPLSEFVYNGESLKLIKTGSSTSYISQKTGLIDSTSNKKIYKYYFR